MKNNKKFIFILLIFTLLITLGTTYSWLTWESTNDSIMNITIGNVINYEYTLSNKIDSNKFAPTIDYKDGEVLEFSLSKYNISNDLVNIYLYINNIDEELKNNSFKYVLEKDNNIISEGNFLNSNTGEKFYILTNEIVNTKKSNYKLYVYIDGKIENDNNMMNKNFNSLLNIEIKRKDDNYEN